MSHSIIWGSAWADFTCGLPCVAYATLFHFLCPHTTHFFFFCTLLVCISEFLFLSFYSQVDEECLGNGFTWIKFQGTTRKPLCAFPPLIRNQELNSDISDLTVFRKVCDASVPSQGCLNFLTEPRVHSNCSNFSIMRADASQKI